MLIKIRKHMAETPFRRRTRRFRAKRQNLKRFQALLPESHNHILTVNVSCTPVKNERQKMCCTNGLKQRFKPPALIVAANRIFQSRILYWSSPESGDLWCTSGVSISGVCSHSEAWWISSCQGHVRISPHPTLPLSSKRCVKSRFFKVNLPTDPST